MRNWSWTLNSSLWETLVSLCRSTFHVVFSVMTYTPTPLWQKQYLFLSFGTHQLNQRVILAVESSY